MAGVLLVDVLGLVERGGENLIGGLDNLPLLVVVGLLVGGVRSREGLPFIDFLMVRDPGGRPGRLLRGLGGCDGEDGEEV